MIQPVRRRNILRAAALLTRKVPRRCVAITGIHHHGDVVARDTGVVDDDGERPELALGALDHGVHLLLIGDVAHHDEALAPEFLDLGDHRGAGRLVGEVVDGHVGARGRQGQGDAAADAAAGAGHEGRPAGKVQFYSHASSR
jgi:hypothetical protein